MIASYGQYSAHGVATGTIEFATRAGKISWTSVSAICSKRALFPHKDPCHVNCSTNYLHSYVNFPALVATSIVVVSSYYGLKGWHNLKPCQYLYLATQMTKGIVKITFYCSDVRAYMHKTGMHMSLRGPFLFPMHHIHSCFGGQTWYPPCEVVSYTSRANRHRYFEMTCDQWLKAGWSYNYFKVCQAMHW